MCYVRGCGVYMRARAKWVPRVRGAVAAVAVFGLAALTSVQAEERPVSLPPSLSSGAAECVRSASSLRMRSAIVRRRCTERCAYLR